MLGRDRGRPGRIEMRTSVELSSNDKHAKPVRSVHLAVPFGPRRRPLDLFIHTNTLYFTVWIDVTSQNGADQRLSIFSLF
jgi:hypothetical protein